MLKDENIFRIITNHTPPTRGHILVSEPFLRDFIFCRSVILLVDHDDSGSMGLVLTHPLSFTLGDLIHTPQGWEHIPIYQGGPLATDTLFFLHMMPHVPGCIAIRQGLYMNGSLEALLSAPISCMSVQQQVRFFLGYSGWQTGQLNAELADNTWIVTREDNSILLDTRQSKYLWHDALTHMGHKYALWAKFPLIPSLN